MTSKIAQQGFRQRLRRTALEALGGKCQQCGLSDVRVLQIDHLRGGGNRARKAMASFVVYYKHVIASALNGNAIYQVLCANCNWIKRAERQEYGHRSQ